MTHPEGNSLSVEQLAVLESSLRRGSQTASEAMAKWIGRPSVIELDALEQLPLEQATTVLSQEQTPICCCSVEFSGPLQGQMVLAFEDASGLALTDLLMEHPVGTNKEWTELCISAVLETTNILCCGYLNSLSQQLVFNSSSKDELLPGPPQFQREFAESLMEFLLMPQAIQFDQVIVATTRFQLNQMPVNWNLIFVPDAASRIQLASLLDDHA